MISLSRAALGAAVLAALAIVSATQPAEAQRKGKQAQLPPPPSPTREYRLTKEERAALEPLQTALAARNIPAASAALPTAQAGARGDDARYILATLQLQLGIETQNRAMQSQAIDALASHGGTPAADLPRLIQNQAALSLGGTNFQRTDALYTRLVELEPNNVDALRELALIRLRQRKTNDGILLLDRAITARQATGQPISEAWYRYLFRLASDNKSMAVASRAGRGLVAAYPKPENWRDVTLWLIETPGTTDAVKLDAWRLIRAARALGGERDYLELAQRAGPTEAKAVLDEGVARRMVDPTKSEFKALITSSTRGATAERTGLTAKQKAATASLTGTASLTAADAYFGVGDYAAAAPLYTAALQKGGVDPSTVNLRLGIALAMAGRKLEAAAPLSAVTGASSELAALWLVWLRQPT
jgi:hypothetical protein